MLERLKRVLVDSFIAAICLGYLLAQAILYFVNIFTAPISLWVTRRIFPDKTASGRFPLEAALPQIIGFVLLLLVWYGLLRWLYVVPLSQEASDAAHNPEQTA
jgi:hypothetical protein